MNILVTGGCGNIGQHVVKVLADKGHRVRVMDQNADALNKIMLPNVETVAGDISNRAFVFDSVKGMDAVIHLAWSFSESPIDLFNIDVNGYIHLLDAAVEHGVKHVINTSTAVTYGEPQQDVIDESHPRIIEKSRSPMYALTKQTTEKLSEMYAFEHELAVNTIMIWYAYGAKVGGRVMRRMVTAAIEDGVIEVPKDIGGSFLQLDDFIHGVELIFDVNPNGELFNLATVYLTWEQVAEIIVAKANPDAKIVAIDREDWTGSSFLAENWHLSIEKAEELLGYKSQVTESQAIQDLSKALESCVAEVKQSRS